MNTIFCPKCEKNNTWLNYVDMTMRCAWWHCRECGHDWSIKFQGENLLPVREQENLPSLSADDNELSAERVG